MRVYFYVSKCQDIPPPGWRTQLHSKFLELHPELLMTEQNVVDRKNVIVKKGYVTPTEIETIRREVGQKLTVEQEQHEIQENTEGLADIREELQVVQENAREQTEEREAIITDQDRPNINEVEERYLSNLSFLQNIDPLKRPRLPQLIMKPTTKVTITHVDAVLRKYLTNVNSLEVVHNTIYTAATTVLEINGRAIHFEQDTAHRHNKSKEPQWKTRITREIDEFRAKADLIKTYLEGIRTAKIKKKIKDVLKILKINEGCTDLNQKLTEHYDLMRQKAKAKGAILKRYNEANKRKSQNRLFAENQKKFYKNINNDIEDVPETAEKLDKQAFVDYWKSIWDTPKTADLNAPWLNKIVQHSSEIQERENPEINLEDIKLALKKVHNWKAPGPDNIQNFWLKSFESIHQPLTKCFQQVLQNPEQIPKFLTIANTYLLFKKGDPADPRNYRPITCLSVLYKLLSAVINNHIYKHCQLNNIIAPLQKGCARGSRGCKDLLICDSVISEQARAKQRNLHVGYIDYSKAYDSVPHNWLMKVLEIYRIHPIIQNILKHSCLIGM
ncbi:uncharacterized protein LOC115883768 [Sitophilus oryzae]|uniref:Uncharacterized protein LOC115883768 n=1 Tax=Sitophilus oryzae TaxID=7048 RepID=A0A6J2Y4X0_SITOR|nr:uncharacterized protein LOC115883768 [Sitophilus oryzae]